MSDWISVKDRLPDPDEKVIVYNAENDGTFLPAALKDVLNAGIRLQENS